ncbi:MAG: zinc ribbon domain-containing protein [Chloroflexi bacterium]|nr:zinc ribbon domain-containing protein [Chloroflexota bacterium]
MPIYVYRCRVCGEEFERMQSFSDTTVPTCPNGHTDVVRVLKPPAIHFKGSGWYITDSKRGNGTNPASQPTKEKEEKSTTSSTSEEK